MLSVANKLFVLCVIMLSVILLSVIMCSVILLSVIMLSVIVCNVIMLNVADPFTLDASLMLAEFILINILSFLIIAH